MTLAADAGAAVLAAVLVAAACFKAADASQAVIAELDGADGRWTAIAFVSPHCQDCQHLLPALQSMAREEADWLRLAVAPAGPQDGGFEPYARGAFDERVTVLRDRGLATELHVHATPFLMVVDPGGTLSAKGIPNRREQLDGLLEEARAFAAVADAATEEPTSAGVPATSRLSGREAS